MVIDGTKFIMKSKYDNVNEFADKHHKLIEEFKYKFSLKRLYSKLPPILSKKEAKSKVETNNVFLNKTYNDKPDFSELKVKSMITNIIYWSFLN